MRGLSTFTYTCALVFIFANLLFVNCSGGDDAENPTGSFELPGTYCLDFSIMGSQMTIEENGSGTYNILINDYDGGLRSATGTATISGTTLSATGQVTTEQGDANFQMTVDIDESEESISGIFNVMNPQGVIFFNASINGTKGGCSFELSPEDLDNVIGQSYLTDLHVDLDKIEKISRYRSAAGHNFVDYSGESCVNLKHYFHTYDEGTEPPSNELPTSLDYFSPANGTIAVMGQARPDEDPTDYEIDIRLASNPNVIVRIFHINPADGLEVGSSLTSGQALGSAPTAHLDSGDFAVYVLTDEGYRHISMFEIMSQSVLDQFIARGVDPNWKQDLYYETTDTYPAQISCENGTWGNLRHPNSRFEDDFFILDN